MAIILRLLPFPTTTPFAMPLDSFIDPTLYRFRYPEARPSRENQQPPTVTGNDGRPGGAGSQHIHGLFHNAHDFVLNNATFVEVNNYINNMVSNRNTALELLGPHTMPDAAMDSSARYPPPTCHPKTRRSIRRKLKEWLYNPKRQWPMIWLRGPAGTGKSAVAQTFAECCLGWGRLGAAYFFSRTGNRNRSETVIPSLVHQLAVAIPEYKSIITTELANDPHLLHKAAPVQFRKLITEPFTTLQHQHPREPVVIILDGLDECNGEGAQLEIIHMITEVLCLHQDFPVVWLICSRPEVHLKQAFSRIADCGRFELVIDAECRDDITRYLRDGMDRIKTRYTDVTPPHWPSEDQLNKLIDTVSGLFVLASTILNYIGDPTRAYPVGQLDDLMTFLKNAHMVGSSNPLAALDLLYIRILSDVPAEVFPTTWRILAHFVHAPDMLLMSLPAQALCNFLRLDQHVFYRALRGLHSVIDIPEPADAVRVRLRFHHISFRDFLLDPNRSGKFIVEQQKAWVDFAKLALHWYDIDLRYFHTNDGWNFDHKHRHDSLPGLTWASTDTNQHISVQLAKFVYFYCWEIVSQLSWANVDEDFLSQIYDLDFRYQPTYGLDCLANWFHKQNPSNSFVRTEPASPTDCRLLEHFNLVVENGVTEPATFPLGLRSSTREYYFIGQGMKSAIVWTTVSGTWAWKTHMLNCNGVPSRAQILECREDLKNIGWKENDAKKYLEARKDPEMAGERQSGRSYLSTGSLKLS